MNERNFHLPWFGIALIVFGVALLFNKLGIITVGFHHIFWPLLMLLGIAGVSKGYARNRRGKIFGGTILFLYSLFFFLRSIESVEFHDYMFLPATFLIFGIAFVMMYLHNFRDWFLLIPAFLLCGIGILFILTEYGYLYEWEAWEAVRLYWPIGLILLGVALILRRRGQHPNQMDPSGTSSIPLS
jgi:hypothetical protein